MKNILGLITARGASRGIPRKNIVPLAGKPLLIYTAEASLASERLTRVVLSTDDDEIVKIGEEAGIEVPFRRPAKLSTDVSSSLDVAQHAVSWLEKNDGWRADAVMILQPTSPLRKTEHIDRAIEIMEENQADTVVSVIEAPHNFNPYSVMQLENGWLKDFITNEVKFDRYRRQDKPKLYARNGPAVLLTRYETLMLKNTFYGEHIAPLFMSEEDSFDIDVPLDVDLVEWLMRRR